jgi:hypothetical protein
VPPLKRQTFDAWTGKQLKLGHRTAIIASLAVGSVGLAFFAAASIHDDGRLFLTGVLLVALASVVAGLALVTARAKMSRVLGTVACVVGVATALSAGAALNANWDYHRGRSLMLEGKYLDAVSSYEVALKLFRDSGPEVLGPPFRVRLSTHGLVKDTRVEMYADLGWVAYSGKDIDTSTKLYQRALDVARSEQYDVSTIQRLEAAVQGIDTTPSAAP